MREEKARLERAAMRMFLRALRLYNGRELHIYEQRERPDFTVVDGWRRPIGVEITHLYHNEEEARYLNGGATGIHPITSDGELVAALNSSLANKALLSFGYEAPDEGLMLLIRVPSPAVQKTTIIHHLPQIVLPPSAFKEIWMLFYDFDQLDWADLLQLG